jgi:hypothetical protein
MCRDLIVTTHLRCSHQVFHTTHCDLGLDCPTPTRIINRFSLDSRSLCPDCLGLPQGRVKSKSGPHPIEITPPPSWKDTIVAAIVWAICAVIIFFVVGVFAIYCDFFWLTLQGKGPMREGIFGQMFTEGLSARDWMIVTAGIVLMGLGWVVAFGKTVYKIIVDSIGWMLDFQIASRKGFVMES